jgi:hypothetical protein
MLKMQWVKRQESNVKNAAEAEVMGMLHLETQN